MATFRTAFRAEALRLHGLGGAHAGNAAHTNLATVDDANNYVIDQFNHDHLTAVDAVNAYNRN